MAYTFNRELSFNSTKTTGSIAAPNRRQRFSPSFMTSGRISNTTTRDKSECDYFSSFGDVSSMLSDLRDSMPSVSLSDITLHIDNGHAMNECLIVQFNLEGKVINLSFVIQDQGEDDPDVMMLATVKGEGFIFRSRSVNAIVRWLSQQSEYIHVITRGDGMAAVA